MVKNYSQKVEFAGFIGDVHAEDTLFETSIAFLKQHNISDIYCIGYFCDGYGNVDKVISTVCNEGIISVQGNHDIWCLEEIMRNRPTSTHKNQLSPETIDFISRLPKTYKIMSPDGEVIFCHGILNNEMAKLAPDDYGYAIESNLDLQAFINGPYPSIMVNGHTHRRMVKQIHNKTIINAGTLFREHNPCFAIVNFINKNVHFYDIIKGIVKSEPEIISFQ